MVNRIDNRDNRGGSDAMDGVKYDDCRVLLASLQRRLEHHWRLRRTGLLTEIQELIRLVARAGPVDCIVLSHLDIARLLVALERPQDALDRINSLLMSVRHVRPVASMIMDPVPDSANP